MQELRSTEILDKEIQEDAQKKVRKILNNAESQYNEIISSVDSKLDEVLKEKDLFYAKKLEAYESNLTASTPLEKARYKVSYVQNLVLDCIDEYLNTLSIEKRIQLVLKKLVSNQLMQNKIKDKSFIAYVYGFDMKSAEKELKSILGKSLLKCEPTDFGKIVLEDENIKLKEGIILESEDKDLRLRLTLSEIVSQILDKNRAELTNALISL